VNSDKKFYRRAQK